MNEEIFFLLSEESYTKFNLGQTYIYEDQNINDFTAKLQIQF